MKTLTGSLLLAGLLAGGGIGAARAAAPPPGIPVYTWTDANGTTHFSDKPRTNGPARVLVVPAPAPPDRTAIAANQAWLARLNEDSQARLARDAAQRLAETRREAALAAERAAVAAPEVQYYPVLYAGRHYRHGYRHYGDHDRYRGPPFADRQANPLPSSFPPGLPSSFPGYLPTSFPELRNSPFTPSPPR